MVKKLFCYSVLGLFFTPAILLGQGFHSWSDNATDLRGRNGEQFTYVCPPSGNRGTVWGTGTYTDDSSICTAAVHAGVITFGSGGTVTIEIRHGVPSYDGSSQNGVNTLDYGSWNGSFVVAGGEAGRSRGGTETISWGDNATRLRDRNGEQLTFRCPPSGSARTVWGSGVYTDDSSICTAAVHDGVIGFGSGGTVTIKIRGGRSSYNGSSRNGVTTRDYGSWGGSFVIVGGGE